jgi:hypothetical protein
MYIVVTIRIIITTLSIVTGFRSLSLDMIQILAEYDMNARDAALTTTKVMDA